MAFSRKNTITAFYPVRIPKKELIKIGYQSYIASCFLGCSHSLFEQIEKEDSRRKVLYLLIKMLVAIGLLICAGLCF